eukprot:s2794_g7.t1
MTSVHNSSYITFREAYIMLFVTPNNSKETRSNCNAVLGASSEASPPSFALKDPLPAIFVAGGPVIA